MSKRKIERISTQNSNDYFAQLITNDRQYKYIVSDFNSISARLVPVLGQIKENEDIVSLNLIYLNRVVANILYPQIIRKNEDGSLIVNIDGERKEKRQRQTTRLNVLEKFKPFIIAKDPTLIDRTLHFDLKNVNSKGLALVTSLSNKHLVVGQKISNASLHLPIVDTVIIDFEIKRTRIENEKLILGVSLTSPTQLNLEKIAKFCLFGTTPEIKDSSLKEKLHHIKENIYSLSNLGDGLTVEIVNNEKDFQGALKIRYVAYKKANKVLDSVNSYKDLEDAHDKHSIIMIAKIGSEVVGTVRMVYSRNESEKFPFEQYLEKNTSLHNDRTMYFEVSRLAIDPQLQRSDILVKLFKEVARITIVNNKTTLCFSTRILRPMYQKIGFKIISEEIPHPTIERETLALMKIESDDFIYGSKMKPEVWEKFSREVVLNLEYGGLLPIDTLKIVEQKFKLKAD